MMTLLYDFGIFLYSALLVILSPFNAKAKLLLLGRRNVFFDLAQADLSGSVIWIHAASLGEFEQGRPLIEAIRQGHPQHKIVLTFFSPSGYEVRKNYNLVDVVCYLPADTKRNALRFFEAVCPQKVFFIKYEFWSHYLSVLKTNNVPVFGVSMIFRREQSFFKWYGGFFRKMLTCFTFFYVQDKPSAALLNGLGFKNVKVVGDTRFDRVKAISESSSDFPLIANFVDGAECVIVAGSTWGADESILVNYLKSANGVVKLIIAPHEIHEEHLKQIEEKCGGMSHRYTQSSLLSPDCSILIVDTIGMLSAIYKYGHIAYVGGGFGKGIHNTLEAATYGMPIFFGPKYQKFKEARDLISEGAGFVINDEADFVRQVSFLRTNVVALNECGVKAKAYVDVMCGATKIIMEDNF